jgi:23S rRNA-intervening sequence protein
MTSVEDLDVFKLAHQLALKTYAVTKKFPKEETFSLVDQMRRAAASVGMNLMEGAMRLGSREYRQFVGIARGSAGGGLLPTDSCQRFEIHFDRDLPRITSWLRPCDSNAFASVTES